MKLLTIKNLSTLKRRADRGRAYFSYLQMLATTTILVKIFNITAWWIYVLGGVSVLALCYLMGYVDDKKKILSNEQEGYNAQNPTISRIDRNIEFIKERLS